MRYLITIMLIVVVALFSCTKNEDKVVLVKSISEKISDSIEKIESTTFSIFITNDVIEKALNTKFRTNITTINCKGRHQVFEDYLASSFKNKEKFWGAAYAAYTGGEWYRKNEGLNMKDITLLKKARNIIMEKARKHLSNPKNLHTLYRKKRKFVLSVIFKKSKADKVMFKSIIQDALKSINQINTNDFLIKLKEYKKLEVKTYQLFNSDGYSADRYERSKEKLKEMYLKMDTNLKITEFFLRRKKEGGKKIINEYYKILTDIDKQIGLML